MEVIIAFVALVISLVNVCYIIFIKDLDSIVYTDRQECANTLKYVFEQSIKNKQEQANNPKFKGLNVILDAYVNALKHLRLIKINQQEELILKFVLKANDYNDGILSDEDFIGCFNETIDSIYNLSIKRKDYVKTLRLWWLAG